MGVFRIRIEGLPSDPMPPLSAGSFEEAKFGYCYEVGRAVFTYFKGPSRLPPRRNRREPKAPKKK
jgi:hypothetical protein